MILTLHRYVLSPAAGCRRVALLVAFDAIHAKDFRCDKDRASGLLCDACADPASVKHEALMANRVGHAAVERSRQRELKTTAKRTFDADPDETEVRDEGCSSAQDMRGKDYVPSRPVPGLQVVFRQVATGSRNTSAKFRAPLVSKDNELKTKAHATTTTTRHCGTVDNSNLAGTCHKNNPQIRFTPPFKK